jgi:transcriptional regulator with XRE-family HTH domain
MAIRQRLSHRGETFGTRVAKARSQKGWTLAELGKEVGVSGTCVWNWEEGNSHPRPASLAQLAKAFGVSREYLLEGEESVETMDASNDRSSSDTDVSLSLAEIASNAREAIAQAAGLPSSKVRISLDYGD